MEQAHLERRRGRRVNVQAPLLIRRSGETPSGSSSSQDKTTKNISLAGTYFETEEGEAFSVNDVVMASVSIPEPQRRDFPFTRVAGKSRVVRVSELPQPGPSGRRRFGIALEFGEDVTALTAIPPRG